MKLDGSKHEKLILPRILDVNGEPLYIDGTAYRNLRAMKANAKRYNGDIVIIIDGEEGSGKSTLGRQLAKVLDPDFTEEQMAYTTDECATKSFKYGKWRAIVLDESKADLDRKNTMSRTNKEFMNFLSQSRQLHKFLIVILPSIYDLDKYVAEHRGRLLFHTYKYRGRVPGHYTLYGKKGIKKLFQFGWKYRNYPVSSPANGCRFGKQEVIDLERYNELKRAALERFRPTNTAPLSKDEIIREYVTSRYLEIKQTEEERLKKLSNENLGTIFGFSRRTLYDWSKEYLEKLAKSSQS